MFSQSAKSGEGYLISINSTLMAFDIDYTAYPYLYNDGTMHILCSRLSDDHGRTDIPEIVIRNFNILGPVFWNRFLEFEMECQGTTTTGAVVFLSAYGYLWAGILRFDFSFAEMDYFRKTFVPLEEDYVDIYTGLGMLPYKAFLHQQLLKPKPDDHLTDLELKQFSAQQLNTLEARLAVEVNTVRVHLPLVTPPEIILFRWP
jgi:hypothetical protein